MLSMVFRQIGHGSETSSIFRVCESVAEQIFQPDGPTNQITGSNKMLTIRSHPVLSYSRKLPSGCQVPAASRRSCSSVGSVAKDAADGWLDLTRFVTGGGGSKSPYDELASEIGKQVSDSVPGLMTSPPHDGWHHASMIIRCHWESVLT